MKFILGKKIGMTQVFAENGTVVPVTRVQAGPCVVTQVKAPETNGDVNAVEIGFGDQKLFRLNRAERGHLKDISTAPGATVRYVRSATIEDGHSLKRGDRFTVTIFTPGEKINVIGTSKGKGFQGVVKRHGFAGGPASHGHKDNLRMPGSIGAGGVQRVFKDMRMGGHMGDEQVTVKNLEVVEVHPDTNELWIKGAIPGARNGVVFVSTTVGQITVDIPAVAETSTPEVALETKPEVTPEVAAPEEVVAAEPAAPAESGQV